MEKNISPHIYALTAISTVIISYFVFYHWDIGAQFYFLPMLGLAFLYALINLARQKKNPVYFKINYKPGYGPLLRKSLARYIIWLMLLYLGYKIYEVTPYYNSPFFKPNLDFFKKLLFIYSIAGLPYFLITLRYKSSSTEDFYDPAIRIIHMFKQISLRTLRGDRAGSIFLVLKKKYNRKVLLNLIMRTYFIPVMVSQISSNMSYSLNLTHSYQLNSNLLTLLMLLSSLIWLTDATNASLAYCMESRWIENRTRSIDLTLSGWMVCLFCYPPLNGITSFLFPFAPNVVSNDPGSLIYTNMTFFYTVKILQVSLLALHVYIDLSLGPSVANITFKKLQTKGLYGIVRHPGTVTKLFFWLITSSFYRGFWSTRIILGQLGWSIIYILRALTEERHLSHHSEYKEYKKKVKYRFIPGLF
jgi:protein-S-isoprenylcysteine O-methyltransferase Ste14